MERNDDFLFAMCLIKAELSDQDNVQELLSGGVNCNLDQDVECK